MSLASRQNTTTKWLEPFGYTQKAKKTPDGKTTHTHNVLGGGVLHVTDEEAFIAAYATQLSNDAKPSIAASTGNLQYIPLVLDLDVKIPLPEYPDASLKRHCGRQQLLAITQATIAIASKHYDIEAPIHVLVTQRNYGYAKAGCARDGAHIHFPNIYGTKDDFCALRRELLQDDAFKEAVGAPGCTERHR